MIYLIFHSFRFTGMHIRRLCREQFDILSWVPVFCSVASLRMNACEVHVNVMFPNTEVNAHVMGYGVLIPKHLADLYVSKHKWSVSLIELVFASNAEPL